MVVWLNKVALGCVLSNIYQNIISYRCINTPKTILKVIWHPTVIHHFLLSGNSHNIYYFYSGIGNKYCIGRSRANHTWRQGNVEVTFKVSTVWYIVMVYVNYQNEKLLFAPIFLLTLTEREPKRDYESYTMSYNDIHLYMNHWKETCNRKVQHRLVFEYLFELDNF